MKYAFSLLLTSLLIVGCVTINVYFPAVAAEKAADRIIDGVWGAQPPAGETASQPQSALPLNEMARQLAAGVLNTLVPVAEAAADIDISSPAVQQLRASMEARHSELAPYYASGAIGLTNDGEVALRDANAVPLKDRNKIKKLVADENADRDALYREIAAANSHPEWAGEIRATFAKRWISKAGAGWYYQNSDGAWQQK